MKAKVYLIPFEGPKRRAKPNEAGDRVTVAAPCPHCGAKQLEVAGTGKRPSKDDRAWEADAFALCCRAPLGILRVEVNTLFGVREDEAVLSGRCRVY